MLSFSCIEPYLPGRALYSIKIESERI
jgi:hypothetical protein